MTLQHLDTVIAFAVVMLGASLMITILSQAISTFLAYRGSNLRWGVKVLLRTANPALTDEQVKNLSQQVLTNELLSDSLFSKLDHVPLVGFLTRRWRLASAVRLEELVRILPAVAQNQAQAGDSAGAKAIAQIAAGADPAAAQQIATLLATLHALAPAQTEEAQQQVQQLIAAAQSVATQVAHKVESWFDSTMDRVSQRFAVQMRVWTVVFSVILAFGAHLDAFHLYTQLSQDAELRAKLAGTADAMTKQAGAILPSADGGTAAPSVVPGIYRTAMDDLKGKDAAAAGLPKAPQFQNRDEAVKWLRDGMKGDPQTDRLAAEYQQLVDSGLQTNADKLLDQSTGVQKILSDSGYRLIPSPYPQPWYKPWETYSAGEFWGTLVCAGLLSLGAPFWFNALKTLSSLRPVVANNEEKEKEQAA